MSAAPPAPVPVPVDLAGRLSSDTRAVIASLRSPVTWLVALAVLAVVAGAWRARRALARDRRLAPRVRVLVLASLDAMTVTLVALVTAWFLWRRAPLLLAVALAVLAAAAGLMAGVRARAWLWSLTMLWRGQVRIGDRLRFGDVDGSVIDVGLFGITVLGADGGRVFVPSARMAGNTFSVASPEKVHPAAVDVRAAEGELSDDDVDLLRRIAALCPYRQRGGVVTVALAPDRRSATVGFRSWSAEGADMAHHQIRRAFATARAADAAEPDTRRRDTRRRA